MLTPELLSSIKRLQIRTRRTVDEVLAGHYRSVFRGQGMEFEEVREYQPGDEVRSIDWKVTARLGRPYVKRYREERELTVMLLVDVSGSMAFGSTAQAKRQTAAEMAAVLAVSALRNNDKVGCILFSDRVERYIPAKKGTAHVFRLLKELLTFEPESRGTDPGAAAAFLAKVQRRRCVAFLLSDFLANGYLTPLKRAHRRHELVAVAVTDPGDFSLPPGGLLRVVDLESGRERLVDCFSKKIRERFHAEREAAFEGARENMRRAGVDLVRLETGGSARDALEAFFVARERRLR